MGIYIAMSLTKRGVFREQHLLKRLRFIKYAPDLPQRLCKASIYLSHNFLKIMTQPLDLTVTNSNVLLG